MPLRGTPWYRELSNNDKVKQFYKDRTGKKLEVEIEPDYEVLSQASSRYLYPKGISKEKLDKHRIKLQEICLQYLNQEQIGGFDFQSKDH